MDHGGGCIEWKQSLDQKESEVEVFQLDRRGVGAKWDELCVGGAFIRWEARMTIGEQGDGR